MPKDPGQQPNEPFKQVGIEFLKNKLDKNNPAYEAVITLLEMPTCKIYPRNSQLPELIQELIEDRENPLVDRKLKLVFIGLSHELARATLYAYNAKLPYEFSKMGEYAEKYITEGMGWFKSAMGHFLVNDEKLDKLDKEALMVNGYNLD